MANKHWLAVASETYMGTTELPDDGADTMVDGMGKGVLSMIFGP